MRHNLSQFSQRLNLSDKVEHSSRVLMEIEHLIRSTERAVGLKPSAMQGEARLRGLWRIIYSKTITNVA
jgi:hypothetical protein